MLELPCKVGHTHVDACGLLTVGAALNFLQDCTMFHLETEPVLKKYFQETNIGMFLAFRQVDFKRWPAFGENIRVRTWVYECNTAYGFRNTVIYDEKEESCIYSYGIGVFVDMASGRPTRIPRELAGSVPLEDPFAMEYLPRKIILPPTEPLVHPAEAVKKYDLDRYRHVNNVRYVTLAQEYLPEDPWSRDFRPARIRVEYKSQAKYGDRMIPKRYDLPEGGCLIALDNEEGRRYAAVEFMAGKNPVCQ